MRRLIFPRNLRDLLWIQRLKILLILCFVLETFILFWSDSKRIIPASLLTFFSEFRKFRFTGRLSAYSVTLISVLHFTGA